MSHAEEFPTTPYDSQITFAIDEVPSDLQDLVNQGAKVARKMHPDYPRGIWFDNVRVHTIRCALTAEHVRLPKQLERLRTPLVRTLWLHDLPEVVCSTEDGFDTSAVIKEDQPDTAAKIELDEYTAAKQIFSPADYELFDQFERGKTILDGKVDSPDPRIQPEAYGAKIIDIGDAEMCFYHYLTAWLIHDDYDGRMPTERPYKFTMNRYGTYLANVEKLAHVLPQGLLPTYRNLLLGQADYLVRRWELVASQKPELMPEYGKELKSHLQTFIAHSVRL